MGTNRFRVKKFKEESITVEEEKRYRSPFILFLINNGKLLFTISLLFSTSVFTMSLSKKLDVIKESTIVEYIERGVSVSFDSTNTGIINGTPITEEYAHNLLSSKEEQNKINAGVVIRLKETEFSRGKIVFYSDKTALIKYNDGEYLRILPVGNDYGIKENGIINKSAKTIKLTGKKERNNSLGIDILYLSDGSAEVTNGKTTIFVRNGDLTSNVDKFYTNLSIVSVPINTSNGKITYSNGTIKENNYIIVDNKKYNKEKELTIHDNIKLIYYENGFVEVIYNGESIIVEKKEHIVYDDNIFEIIDQNKEGNNLIDIKNITLTNLDPKEATYIIVLEESTNLNKYDISKRLPNKYIKSSVMVNSNIVSTKLLDNNIKDKNIIAGLNNDTYLIYEGKLPASGTAKIKLGMWIDYETITNEYMNSGFVGTVKIYIEK